MNRWKHISKLAKSARIRRTPTKHDNPVWIEYPLVLSPNVCGFLTIPRTMTKEDATHITALVKCVTARHAEVAYRNRRPVLHRLWHRG